MICSMHCRLEQAFGALQVNVRGPVSTLEFMELNPLVHWEGTQPDPRGPGPPGSRLLVAAAALGRSWQSP